MPLQLTNIVIDSGIVAVQDSIVIQTHFRDAPTSDLNPADYWEMLESFDLNDEQKVELLACLWKLMNSFAALGFGQEPTQSVISDIERESTH